MTRSARAVAVDTGLTDRPAKIGRFKSKRAGASPKRQVEGYPPRRIAHDFNNLLGVITLNLEVAREHANCGGELRKLIDEALGAAWQGSELTSRIAGSARHRRA